MSKNQAYIAIGLEDLTQVPLKRIVGNLFSIQTNVKETNSWFQSFGAIGKKETEKVEKSIVDLENEIEDLKNKRMFEKDITNIRKFNQEIEDLENELNNLKNTTTQTGNAFDNIAAKSFQFNQIADAVQGVAEGLSQLTQVA